MQCVASPPGEAMVSPQDCRRTFRKGLLMGVNRISMDHPSGATGCRCRQFDSAGLTGFVILDDCSDMAELAP